MIVSFIIGLVDSALGFVFRLIPSWSMPGWLTSGTAFPSGVATAIGGYLRVVAPFLPVDLILTVLQSVFSLWPAVVGYLIFQWVWQHVPTVAGFGTGDG